MIPRHQIVLFIILAVASSVMGVVLWHLRDRAHSRLLVGQDTTPTQAPQAAPVEQATLLVANDSDNSLETRVLSLPLPANPNARARAVLGRLLDLYAAPGAAHPVPGGAKGIAEVFLLPANPFGNANRSETATSQTVSRDTAQNDGLSGPELAVVDLAGSFVATHPSGLETETLTIMSICATLHANLPRVTKVRFLVDGQARPTLADHADLTRTYLTAETVPTAGAPS